MVNPEPWMPDAECVGENPELFWPRPTDTDGLEKAREICLRCPVLTDCFVSALQRREQHGVWAGQLAPMKKRRFREDQALSSLD